MSFTVTATETQKYQLYILATTKEKGKNKATYSQTYISHINIKKIPFWSFIVHLCKVLFQSLQRQFAKCWGWRELWLAYTIASLLNASKCAHKRQILGTARGGLFLAREEEWKTQIDLVENQRGRLEGRIRGRPPCSFTDVHFQTPQTQSESSRH